MEYELVEYDNEILINTLEIPRGLSHMTVHLEILEPNRNLSGKLI